MLSLKGGFLRTEEDADTRKIIVSIVSHPGYEVIWRESSEEALEIAKAQTFDLFLDSWLPGESRVQLCETLREFDQKDSLEAAREVGAQIKAIKAGMNDEQVN